MTNREDWDLILSWAIRSAYATRSRRISVAHMLCSFQHYVGCHPGVDQAIQTTFLRGAFEVHWPTAILNANREFEKTSGALPTQVAPPFDDTLQAIVDGVVRRDRTLSLGPLLQGLLCSGSSIARELMDANRIELQDSNAPKPSNLVSTLDDILRRSRSLKEILGRTVLGQDQAVDMLSSAYYQACATQVPEGRGPKGIFTFLGPQGVGKTLLAETFAQALKNIEGRDMPFKRLDMELYTTYADFQVLFSGNEGGELTGFVNANPECVLLFDEIEKALPDLIQALLPMLDSGRVRDKSLRVDVDFSKVWIIFTTNLGREYFDRNSPLAGGASVSAEIFDLLASARLRKQQGDRNASSALSPEFVSRLAKGGAVILADLEARHYLELISHSLTLPEPLPKFQVSTGAQATFLLSLLPNLDARRVATRSRAWALDLLREAHSDCQTELGAMGDHPFSISVDLDHEAASGLSARLAALELLVLVVDDDPTPTDLIADELAKVGTKTRRCASLQELKEVLERTNPAFVLLDLNIHHGATSSEVNEALDILAHIRRRRPSLPVYLYSENPQDRVAFQAVAARALSKGGAAGFIPYLRKSPHPATDWSFLSRVMELERDARLHALVRSLERARTRLHFQVRTRFNPAKKMIEIEIGRIGEEVVVNAVDQGAHIGFAGIPTERLSDVIGLDRAKARLRQVLGWLRDPRALRALGGQPPRGYLLTGPPGVGKTLLAQAFAGEAGLPFLPLAASELTAYEYGESEERIRDIFSLARKYAPSVIFIDELDGVAMDRAQMKGENQWMASVVNQLLSCMDGHHRDENPVFVLGATNHPDHIDPALRRPGRFDELITLDLPSHKARVRFFQKKFEKVPGSASIDIESLARATTGKSPAYLDRLVREAIYLAASENRTNLTQADFQAAKRLVVYGAQADIEIDPKELELTAHHEAGHAILRCLLFPLRPIDFITIAPTEGGVLGFVATPFPENQHDIRRQEVLDELVVLMGGREAERHLRGDDGITTGASQDLVTAAELARSYVLHWGFSDEYGPMVELEGLQGGDPAPLTSIRKLLRDAKDRAFALLEAHSATHARIVRELMDQQSLEWKDLQRILADDAKATR